MFLLRATGCCCCCCCCSCCCSDSFLLSLEKTVGTVLPLQRCFDTLTPGGQHAHSHAALCASYGARCPWHALGRCHFGHPTGDAQAGFSANKLGRAPAGAGALCPAGYRRQVALTPATCVLGGCPPPLSSAALIGRAPSTFYQLRPCAAEPTVADVLLLVLLLFFL